MSGFIEILMKYLNHIRRVGPIEAFLYKMGRAGKIITFSALLLSGGLTGYAQANRLTPDSLQVKEKQGQSGAERNEQKAKGNAYGQTNRNNELQSPKQIKGSRPDMSKARGARPPTIVRPSGSGIPKGAGKPGGAGRKGGR